MHRRRGRLGQARSAYADAADAARAAGDDDAFVEAAIGIGGLWLYEQRDVVERARVEDVWQQAASTATPGSLLAARLAMRRAAEAAYEAGSPASAVWEAADHVHRFGDDSASAEALSLLHHVLLGPRDADARLPLAEEILRLGVRAGDEVIALQGLCWRTVDLFLAGDSRALQSHRELAERTEAADCEAMGFVADVMAAMLAARAGRLDEAEAIADAAFGRGSAAGDPDAAAYYGAMLAALRWWQGRASEIIEAVRLGMSSPRLVHNDHVYIAGHALLAATLGDHDAADEALARLPADRMAMLEVSSSWLTMQFLVVETAFVLGNAEVALEAAVRMEPFAHLPVMPSLAVVCFGSVERSLGLARAVSGDLGAAVEHLEAAIEADRRLGNRPMRALTEHALAAVLRVRRAPGDPSRTAEVAARAADRAARCGVVLGPEPAWLEARSRMSRQGEANRHAVVEAVPGGWRVQVGERATVLADRIGLVYLAELLAQPRVDHPAVHLASSGAAIGDSHVADQVLDDQAIESYRRRARVLESSLGAGLSDADKQRIHSELRDIAEALQAAMGLGGRVRHFADTHERARTAVRKALVRAIDAVAAVEPAFGAHLRSSIITGSVCRYDPQPGWSVTTVRRR